MCRRWWSKVSEVPWTVLISASIETLFLYAPPPATSERRPGRWEPHSSEFLRFQKQREGATLRALSSLVLVLV